MHQPLTQTLLISAAAGLLIVAIYEIMSAGISSAYPYFMLCLLCWFVFMYRKKPVQREGITEKNLSKSKKKKN